MKTVFLSFVLMSAFASVGAGADAASGMLKWEDITDHGGTDSGRAVAISGQTAVVAELLTAPGNGLDFTVKAYDIDTGQPRWEDHVPAFPGLIGPVYLATLGDSAFALGYTPGAPGPLSSSNIFTRAYRISTGNVLWSNTWTVDRENYPNGIVAISGRVTVVGYAATSGGLLRTFNAESGAILWTTITTENSVWSVASDGSNLVTAGSKMIGSRTDLILRAYNHQTGAVLWEVQRPATYGQVDVSGTRVFVAGYTLTTAGTNSYLSAFNLTTGSLLWEAPSVSGAIIHGIAASTARVVTVASIGPYNTVVQSIDPATGAAQWTNTATTAPMYSDFLFRAVITPNAIYAIGNSGKDFEYSEWMLRAFSFTGTLLMDDHSHRSRLSGGSSVGDFAIDGTRLVLVGSVTNQTMDVVVLAYDVSALEPPPFRITLPSNPPDPRMQRFVRLIKKMQH